MPQPPVIFFIGPVGNGKSEARKIACEITGLDGASCSDVIDAFIAARRKIDVAEWRKLPKEERRPVQIAAGDFLTGKGRMEELPVDSTIDKEFFRIPSGLIRVLFHHGTRVIDGVRRRQELGEARAHLEWLGIRSVVIWVERPGAPVIPDNTELTRDDADEHIVNDGNLAALHACVLEVLKKYAPPKEEVVPKIYIGEPKNDIVTAPIFLGRGR